MRSEAWPEAGKDEADPRCPGVARLFDQRRGKASNPRWSGWLVELATQKRAAHFDVRRTLWIAAERLPQFRALWPKPNSSRFRASRTTRPGRGRRLVEILRGRLEGLGPVTSVALAVPLGWSRPRSRAALAALEVEGFALRGRFTPGTNGEEWCDRRLLARIHHYTIRRLRAEIEPVAARDFLRSCSPGSTWPMTPGWKAGRANRRARGA